MVLLPRKRCDYLFFTFEKKNTRLFFQKRRRVIPWSLNLFERKYYEFALPLRISENGNPKFLLYSFKLKPSQVSCLAKNIWFHNCCSFHLWPQILIRSLLTFNNCNTKDYWIYFYSKVNVSTSAIRFKNNLVIVKEDCIAVRITVFVAVSGCVTGIRCNLYSSFVDELFLFKDQKHRYGFVCVCNLYWQCRNNRGLWKRTC